MASLRQVRRCTSRHSDSIYAVRSWWAPHRRPYGGIRMYVVATEFAFPFGGPNARENVQWTFSSEDGPVRPMGGAPAGGGRGPRSFPHAKGGLPARTIERARLTAMWAAGEVPGSEGKPPKTRVPRPPERMEAVHMKPPTETDYPMSGHVSLVVCFHTKSGPLQCSGPQTNQSISRR